MAFDLTARRELSVNLFVDSDSASDSNSCSMLSAFKSALAA